MASKSLISVKSREISEAISHSVAIAPKGKLKRDKVGTGGETQRDDKALHVIYVT